MSKNSHIEWTHHTFNPWWGCTKVSPACDNCYADLWARRMGQQLWGRNATRRFFSDLHWKEPLRWNEEAQLNGRRERVFCASMADVFERRADLNDARNRLWQLITDTPNLDWLLLTKRPQNITRYAPWQTTWPENVWIGTSIENQIIAEKRLPFLLQIPAAIRFLSCEPLLGMLDLSEWFNRSGFYPIDWIIAGGESGARSRPMHPDWVTGLLNQCLAAETPFHFKQWGQWAPLQADYSLTSRPILVTIQNERPIEMVRMTKKLAGRQLQGTTWDGVPHTLTH
jgi:protein gp37